MILPARSARYLLLALGPLLSCSAPPLALSPAAAPPPAPSVPAGPALLEKGAPVEKEIHAGETHEYRIAANAGDYARVRVDQTKVDVAVRLVGPGGEEIRTVDGVGGRKEPELLSWITAQGGDFQLLVTSRETGTYKLILKELRTAVEGDTQRVTADRAMNEADHWLSRQNVESKQKALAKYEEALALWQTIGDQPQEVHTLNQIGAIHRGLGNVDKALALYERSLILAKSAGDRWGEAEALNNRGVARHERNQVELALQDVREALKVWEGLGDQQGMASASYSLGVLQMLSNQNEEAVVSLSRALELRRTAGDPSTVPLILGALGSIYREKGEGDKALEMYQQALRESHESGNQLGEANVLQEMAVIYLRRGELQHALELFTQALELHQRLGNRSQEGKELSYLGTTALYLGDFDRAFEFYSRALEIHRALNDKVWEASTLSSIGRIRYQQGKVQEALLPYTQAYEISRSAKDRRNEATALYGIGLARIALGNPNEGIGLLKQALTQYQETGAPIGEINVALELGRAFQSLSETEQAYQQFHWALDIARRNRASMSEAVALSAISRLERERGNLLEAATNMEAALQIIESIRPKVAAQRQRVFFFASRRDYYDFYIDLQMRLHERDPDGDHLARALAASERARARGLLDLLAEGRIDLQRGISPELKKRDEEIGNRISLLQADLLDEMARGRMKSSEIEAELDRAEEEREKIEWQIQREYPHYATVRNPAPLSALRIQEMLDTSTGLLEFAVGRESSYLFVVTREHLEGHRLPGSAELAALVDDLRTTLKEPGRRQYSRYVEAAYRLYQILLEPAAAALRDRPNLIISPDGPLLLLSFEALLTARDPERASAAYADLPYLIRKKSVSYVPSASVLAELGGSAADTALAASESGLFLGFADPITSTNNAGLAPQLPHSRTELLEIASLFPPGQVRLYLGDDAAEKNVKGNPWLKEARWVHFAVHGFVNEERPELSGLVLSDGLLQSYEIFNLELTADLVVLSACDTALGKNISGEGLLGVSRALLYAGAASVIVSLWQVADNSTSELMVRFYRHRNASGGNAEALRMSKLDLIREGVYANPYHWAPFILTGRPGAEVTSRRFARQ